MIARLLTVVASGLGYVPPRKDWIPKLQTLRGEFRRSPSSNALLIFIAATCIICGTTLGLTELLRPNHPLRSPDPALLAMSLVLLILGISCSWRQFGVRYLFEKGQLTCISASGSVRWTEDLGALTSVTYSQYRGQRSLTFLWREHRRTIELFDSLWIVLNTRDQ
jgi:hypothetical protein